MQELTNTPFEDVPSNLGCLAVMGGMGDIKYAWDPKKPEDVNAARIHFAELKAKGYQVFRMRRWGSKGTPVEEFDAKDAKLLFVAPKDQVTAAPTDDGEQVQGEPEVEKGGHYVAVPPMQGG